MSTTEQESRQIAEQARETEWEGRTFLRELFLGKLSLPLIHPFPLDATLDRPEFTRFYQAMETFLREQVDSAAIDQTGEYPEHVLDGQPNSTIPGSLRRTADRARPAGVVVRRVHMPDSSSAVLLTAAPITLYPRPRTTQKHPPSPKAFALVSHLLPRLSRLRTNRDGSPVLVTLTRTATRPDALIGFF